MKVLKFVLCGLSLTPFLFGCTGGESGSKGGAGTTASSEEHDLDHASGEHDHEGDGEEVATYPAALAKLTTWTTEITAAFKEEKPEDAHDALHSVGHLLESLPTLAAKHKTLGEDEMGQLKQAVEAMFDAFGDLDGTLHGGEAVEFSSVEEKLTKALEELRSFE